MTRLAGAGAGLSALVLLTLSMFSQPLDQAPMPGLASIPGGTFEMGDHHGFVDPKHGSDEIPIHYERNYYAYSPAENPPGPAQGSPMPDGKAYRCMRAGSWFNGEFGHSRVSNRDPSYFRGPDPITHRSDPDGPWFHIGFRVVLPVSAESRPLIQPTPFPVNDRPRAAGALNEKR